MDSKNINDSCAEGFLKACDQYPVLTEGLMFATRAVFTALQDTAENLTAEDSTSVVDAASSVADAGAVVEHIQDVLAVPGQGF